MKKRIGRSFIISFIDPFVKLQLRAVSFNFKQKTFGCREYGKLRGVWLLFGESKVLLPLHIYFEPGEGDAYRLRR